MAVLPTRRVATFSLLTGVIAAALRRDSTAQQARGADHLIFIGTFTDADSRGIYAFRFNGRTGALAPIGLVAETPSPAFLAMRADGRVLVAVNEIEAFNGHATGSLTSFAVDAETGALKAISAQASEGTRPCHLALDRRERVVAVANYNSGTFAVLPIAPDGRLGPATSVFTHSGSGPNRDRQEGPHAHHVAFTPDNGFLFGTDLGVDRVFVYRVSGASAVVPHTPPSVSLPAGGGPRHLVMHPNGRFVYLVSELNSTVTTLAWDATRGVLTRVSSASMLPETFSGTSTAAEIAIHPNGQFLYASNRGHDSIAVFRIGPDGSLTRVSVEPTRGRTPRHFSLDPTGRWLIAANQDSGTLAIFQVNDTTGLLTGVGDLAKVPSPVCVLFA